ncbi:MAG: DEAD/DEAH box helicase [Clostridia bacterium]|nr:DEAD/DEAH box helicase [Clostridia bacterium]
MQITDEMIQEICSKTIYMRGLDYFRQGRVHLRRRDTNIISAIVDGDDLYDVHIRFFQDKIKDYFCSCPYYQTMQSTCKHIVAVLKQRQAELTEYDNFTDENDIIASNLCKEFNSLERQKEKFRLFLTIRLNTSYRRNCEYFIELKYEKSSLQINRFLEAYSKNTQYKINTKSVYSKDHFSFDDMQIKILDLLAEAYQNKFSDGSGHVNAATSLNICPYTAKRLFELLDEDNFELFINGLPCHDLRIKNENPDILIDILGDSQQIHLSISESGLALTPDGSWFFYEGDLYRTDPKWQSWFMPIYNALNSENRTQIRFKGDNAINFAAKVLPVIKDKHGVAAQGLDDMIINEHPAFEVYFDKYKNGISAVIKALYGSFSIRLPSAEGNKNKIIVRDYFAEENILSYFKNFNIADGIYVLEDDDDIYEFISNTLHTIPCALYYSNAFEQIRPKRKLDIKGHIRYNYDIDLLEADFESDLSPDEIRGILSAVRLKKKYYRLPDGSFLDVYEDASSFELLEKLNFNDNDIKNSKKLLQKHNLLYLAGLADAGLKGFYLDNSFIDAVNKIKNIKACIPDYMSNVLRTYQKYGVNWFKQLSELGLGGILADDMGLGKTLQVIAFVCGENKAEPALIICPSALTYNWLNEIQRFSPSSNALIIDGTKKEREALIKNYKAYDFIITSYPLLRRDIQMYSDLHFCYCFIDEAQHIKNYKTMNAKSVKKINADRCFALTGTPIENSLSELWSIFDFIMPGYLYSYSEFFQRFERPISKEDDSDSFSNLKDKIKPFILRRMKTDVLSELPEKIENTVYAELTTEQKKLYMAYLASAKNEISSLVQDRYENNKIRILALLTRLRQICCHPSLFDAEYKKESGKLLLLEELLSDAVGAGHRALVFSQFTSMLEIIKKRLVKLGISYFYLDGSIPSHERTKLADKFNAGENSVFLISLKAGGTGLNLIGADTVIHYDPWWNPSVMDQASDRAYRIGQKKAVQVIKLASKGTIEEKIIKLQEKKRSLADGIITANKTTIGGLSKEELLALFD